MKMDFLKYRYVFFAFSLIVIIGGIVFGLVTGFKFDIDFKGGTKIEVDLKEEFNNADIENIVKEFTKSYVKEKDLVLAQYIMKNQQDKLDNLESDKQKLREKLEKDIREETGYVKWTNSYTKEISPAVTEMISKSKYAQEILSVLKGKKKEEE